MIFKQHYRYGIFGTSQFNIFTFSSTVSKNNNKNVPYYNFTCSLYWCETLLFTSREEHRLRIFENRGPRKLIVYKREEVKGGCRKLLNKLIIFIFQ